MYKAIITTKDNNGIHKERVNGDLIYVLSVIETYAIIKKYVHIVHITLSEI